MAKLNTQISRAAKWMDSRIGKKPLMVCLPFAGGGASIYTGWKQALSEYVEVSPIFLPGREIRSNEIPIDNMYLLINELVSYWKFCEYIPDVVFGHSMGAAIAYELCAALQSNGMPIPSLLIISGHASPHAKIPYSFHQLEDHLFIKSIHALGGLDSEIINSPELIEYLLPILRADFTLIETWKPSGILLSNTEIWVISGSQDEQASLDKMSGWSQYSSRPISSIKIQGNHFFIHKQRTELLIMLAQKLNIYFNKND
jgi:surfactin synthase thioesterase subunit